MRNTDLEILRLEAELGRVKTSQESVSNASVIANSEVLIEERTPTNGEDVSGPSEYSTEKKCQKNGLNETLGNMTLVKENDFHTLNSSCGDYKTDRGYESLVRKDIVEQKAVNQL
jgi:hypothetical protein